MVKIPKQKSIRLKVTTLTLVTATILISVASFFVFQNKSTNKTADAELQTNQVDYDVPTNEQINAGNNTKSESVKSSDKTNSGDEKSQPKPDDRVELILTAANQDPDSGSLQIRTQLDYVTNIGTCYLTMHGPQEQKITREAGVQSLPSTSTCKGFDIPKSELYPGEWRLVVDFHGEDLAGTASKSITIK